MTPSNAPANARRPENLALILQEVLTAIERLRANRQGVTDANAFRHHTLEALRSAANQALAAGYNADDVKLASFACVAFLDESVLNSQNPIFADWLRKPLQEELFGTHVAGEAFFQHLQQLLGRPDSHDLADLLEVHYLCLVLGFGGRYGVGNRGELAQAMQMTADKIRRTRGPLGPLSPSWMPTPGEAVKGGSDPLVRKLGILAVVCAALMILSFVIYKVVLGSGVSAVHSAASFSSRRRGGSEVAEKMRFTVDRSRTVADGSLNCFSAPPRLRDEISVSES
jgi:type VI secretion system protein ImpK